ncbi:arginine deiminase [Candidatus Sulfidibacterium hydrothermale]|uniref:arginine deiminase n=1 Tax=Candidatus Sulfidibacterium hydrothermale TaxID=2875962 RepID=UPI001F0B5F6B|nr:arginine deiminase family protein [Candidatus Sulfidibacterium hydrothermale]UBM63148.1 arginine deiminase [Candidatus Sulfidibacterium hydrothermale]
MDKITVSVNSEIGKIKGVIVHTPGAEVENMTPENAERALYSDILNLSVAIPEYNEFLGVLQKQTSVFEVTDLLQTVLENDTVRKDLIGKVCEHERHSQKRFQLCDTLQEMPARVLARKLITGVEMQKNNLTSFLDDERFSLSPLPNFFFTRDASFSVGNGVMISKMANAVRDREALIMETIFSTHPLFETAVVNPVEQFDNSGRATIEGGDVQVARDDVLVIGTGDRTTTQGIDSMIEYLKTKPGTKHILAQELPYKPESFIHLDMTFTFLDKDQCMVFEPLILNSSRYLTIHIVIDGDKVSKIKEERSLLHALRKLGIDMEPVSCGGNKDLYFQEREQWQSGANFFAMEPGKVIGYERNVHTIENMNRHGFEIIKAADVISGKVNLDDYKKVVVTIKGNELSRGGGGARCMTMPVAREKVNW